MLVRCAIPDCAAESSDSPELCILAVLARIRRKQEAPKVVALGIIALAALALIAWVGAEAIQETRIGGADLTFSRRNSMARAAKNIFVDYPVKGVGLGALASVYPRYENTYDGLIVEHVHNDYLEGLAETGVAGGLCGLAFLWLLFGQSRTSFTASQGYFSRGLALSAIAAVAGLALSQLDRF